MFVKHFCPRGTESIRAIHMHPIVDSSAKTIQDTELTVFSDVQSGLSLALTV